tara:strand:+ start:202 stop:498 length:297 start_codon:yes stop_codon:yes gene_type:complete
MEELRLIANPVHLGKTEIIKKPDLKNKINESDKLKEILQLFYSNLYFSDVNIEEIRIIIHNYIYENIIVKRLVDDVIQDIITEVIESSDKFDFCLPFD